LCPYFWDGFEFNAKYRDKLLSIAKDFISTIDILEDVTISDIILTGSITNYNWTEQSDLDLHIKVSIGDLGGDVDLLKNYFTDEKTLWNMKHDITLKGFPVEIYIEDVNDIHITEYSLMRDEWNVKPVYDRPVFDNNFVDKKVDDYISKINYYDRRSAEENSNEDARLLYDKVSALKDSITKKRREQLQKSRNEFNEYNLIFKKLRNLGYLDKVSDLVNKLYDASYTQ